MLSPTARIFAAGIALGCLSVLIIAFLLEPSARGMGSHTRLGLPPCGWLAMFGKPCITCGYTTTFALTAKGSLLLAFKNQPAAMLLCITTTAAMWLAGYAALTGARIDRIIGSMAKPAVLWSIAAIVLLSWGYKVMTYAA
ncbi:MAG TPA: hypothetical protein VK157_08045 [Phycisphaerales bacterium]|nr:hypothetical protein [Phycisphaerales bacterium]